MSFWGKLFGTEEKPAPPPAIPPGENPEALLPAQIGPFRRDPLRLPASAGMSIYADYRHDAATVFVELGICADEADAQCVLETGRDEAGAQPAEWRGRPCVKSLGDQGAFIAWTRGKYYFSAHAKGGERDLEAFLAAFTQG